MEGCGFGVEYVHFILAFQVLGHFQGPCDNLVQKRGEGMCILGYPQGNWGRGSLGLVAWFALVYLFVVSEVPNLPWPAGGKSVTRDLIPCQEGAQRSCLSGESSERARDLPKPHNWSRTQPWLGSSAWRQWALLPRHLFGPLCQQLVLHQRTSP